MSPGLFAVSTQGSVGLTLFASLTAPLILVLVFLYVNRKNKLEDYRRQDARDEAELQRQQVVADKAEEDRRAAAEVARKAELDRVAAQAVVKQVADAAELLRLQNFEAAANREEVAAQAAQAAKLLLASNAEVAETARQTKEELSRQLGDIHTLVNNNLTQQMLDVLQRSLQALAAMEENVRLNQQLGIGPSETVLTAIAAIKVAIADLKQEIQHRGTQLSIVQADPPADPDHRRG